MNPAQVVLKAATKVRLHVYLNTGEDFIYETYDGIHIPPGDVDEMVERLDDAHQFTAEYFVPFEDRWYTQAEIAELNTIASTKLTHKDPWLQYGYK